MAQGATSFELAAKPTNELGVDLHRQLAIGDENLCISPYSIDSALAMTFAGADGETRRRDGACSKFSKCDDVPASFSALQQSLEQMSAKKAELVKDPKSSAAKRTDYVEHRQHALCAKGLSFSRRFSCHR